MSYIETKIMNAFVICIIVLIIMMSMLFFFPYQPYIKVYGEQNAKYVDLYLSDQEISNLTHKLKYKDEIIDYEIIEISNDYIIHENEFKRNIKIDFNHNQNEYIIELFLAIGEETNIWDYFYQKYMKGVV